MRDHPNISRAMTTGYHDLDSEPTCPVCGDYCSKIYRDSLGNVVGCDNCISCVDAWEEMERGE